MNAPTGQDLEAIVLRALVPQAIRFAGRELDVDYDEVSPDAVVAALRSGLGDLRFAQMGPVRFPPVSADPDPNGLDDLVGYAGVPMPAGELVRVGAALAVATTAVRVEHVRWRVPLHLLDPSTPVPLVAGVDPDDAPNALGRFTASLERAAIGDSPSPLFADGSWRFVVAEWVCAGADLAGWHFAEPDDLASVPHLQPR